MNNFKVTEVEEYITNLLNKMTIEEKIGQLQQLGPSLVGAFEVSFEELLNMMFDGRISHEEFERLMSTAEEDLHEEDIRSGKLGSLNGIYGAEKINRLQKIAIEESRLGIPLLFGADVIHGLRSVYPIPLGISCSFNRDLWRSVAHMAGEEASANGLHWTFAPMLDIARDPRWGRISEGAGEDPYLVSEFAKASVSGFQGEDISEETSILACAKHFVAYGGAEAGRDYNTVDISRETLHDVYLPPFKAAVEAGVATIMPGFNDVAGVPCTVNTYLLKEVLRDDYGFEGFLVSDANAIAECVNHGVASDKKEASQKAITAGVDMDMSSNSYIESLKELVEGGAVPQDILDESVRRVLRMKYAKGLFNNPYITNKEKEAATILKDDNRKLCKKAAYESIVLLKNDGVLPLKENQKVALVGQLANDKGQMLGAWSIAGNGKDCVTVVEAMTKNKHVTYEMCCPVQGDYDEKATRELVEHADVIVAVLGETKEMSGEAASRGDIGLPGMQEEFVKTLVATGKPVVVVLFGGRPLAIPCVAEHANAIVEGWHLGIEAGNAIKEVLYGEVNPSGKLTVSYPHSVGQCPIYYNHFNTGRPAGAGKFTSKYLDIPNQPLYPFGYGLSYTTYQYDNLKITSDDSNFYVSVTVSNTGTMEGQEIVQFYIRDLVASKVRPVKELKDFEKINLLPGEIKVVSFILEKSRMGFYKAQNNDLNYVIEPGKFKILVGTNSIEYLEAEVEI